MNLDEKGQKLISEAVALICLEQIVLTHHSDWEEPTEDSQTILVPINFPKKILEKIDSAIGFDLLNGREHVLQSMGAKIVNAGLTKYAMSEPTFLKALTAEMEKRFPDLAE